MDCESSTIVITIGRSTSLSIPLIKIPNNNRPKRKRPKLRRLIRTNLLNLEISLTQDFLRYNNKDRATTITAQTMSVHNGMSLKYAVISIGSRINYVDLLQVPLFLLNTLSSIQNMAIIHLLWLFPIPLQ